MKFTFIYTIEAKNIFFKKVFACKADPKKKYKKLKK
jgi:hypothetical protein